MTKKYNKITPKYNLFNIDWLIGTVCNYNCSYCGPYLHDGKYKFVDLQIAKDFLLQVKKEKPDKDIILIISGGEPTLWKDLPEFMRFSRKRNIEIQLITNGSPSVKWWVENAMNIDLIVISFHWEQANPKHIHDVCLTLRNKYKSHIKVNILVKKEKFEESYELAKYLEKNIPGIIIELRPLRIEHGMYLIDYTDEQLKRLQTENRFGGFLERHRYQIILTNNGEVFRPDLSIVNKENCWKGWECHIGLESLKILYDGTVMRGNCDNGNPLGNIFNGITLPSDPIICNRDFCKCVTDIRTTKMKINF